MKKKETTHPKGRLKKNSLVQAWLVLLLATGFGVSLAGVQMTLGPKIDQNKINETREKVPALVLGNDLAAKMAAENQSLEITPRQVAVQKRGQTKYYQVLETRYQGDLRGWVVKAKGQGYADAIELLLGLSPDLAKITGLFILDQKETPGLGNKIITAEWRNQFIGKPTEPPLRVVKSGAEQINDIDAITGATISSKSVTGMINRAVGELNSQLTPATANESSEEKNNG